MSKRTDTIKSLFAATPAPTLSADNVAPALPARVSAGAVRSLKDSFSEVEKENQELRDRLSTGAAIIEIDPALVDASPVSDRFQEDDTTSYEALKRSIAQSGQEVPILVRAHPATAGRYQSAYGHRRVRVARELGIPVKAILRSLADEELIVAQGLENAPREDLSFIERAIFAMRIEDAGHKRSIVQDALAVDRAEASKLISVARAIPHDVVNAIGKAPKAGRGRWQTFADLLGDASTIERVRTAIADSSFAIRDSDARFLAAFSAASQPSAKQESRRPQPTSLLAADGRRIAEISQAERELKLSIDKNVPASFADYLVKQIPHLFDAFSASDESRGSEA
ncbi:plasmid partitioning protein RepB [Bradyrhizobium jicamae]|uniref:Plasmid partitioning protein RepB n=1 Tax=Bradyrhizobium jicamae TaxID=280332 RepID=A0ABS5FVA5_9BRAD|nr:plasmid partitioning protein RepB [Bradyrhizobium jicamae]MBR0800765.1 plasmid partitioning protein RepB [Bradyrhizobium jicamae]